MPAPDTAITQLEDKILKEHLDAYDVTAKMSKLQVSGKKGGGPPPDNYFPCRPAFGTNGKEVILWANYFKLSLGVKDIFKYSIEVHPVKKEGTKAQPRDAKGRKLHKVGNGIPLVSEFKSQVVTLKELPLPEDGTVTVKYTIEGKDDEYKVKFSSPQYIDLTQLMSYLSSMHDPTGSTSFPKFETTIDAVSVIIGHSARASDKVSSVGRSRFFPLDRADQIFSLGPTDFNSVIRGYFQSARPATGRLLLNANVSHGVFRIGGPALDVMKNFDLQNNASLQALHKCLGRLRARVTYLADTPSSSGKKGKKPSGIARVGEKGITGLATRFDGSGEHKPRVASSGAGPQDVQFWLKSPAPAGLKADAYITVSEYFENSKRLSLYGREKEKGLC